MNVHPLADLIPAMSDEDYQRLRDDIAENGLQQPIVTHEDMILDGRHRFRACEDTGREPRFIAYEGKAPARFVLSANISRRHLTTSQLAMVAVEFLPVLQREAKERQGARNDQHKTSASIDADVEDRSGRSAKQAADAVGVGEVTVGRAKRITRDAPDLAVEVKAGSMTVDKAINTLKQREADDAPSNGNGRSKGQPLPAETLAALSERNRNVANKNRKRIHTAIAGLGGYADGLVELDLTNLHHITHEDEARHWHDQIRHVTHQLRVFDKALKEAQL